jgi:hypothetical protein
MGWSETSLIKMRRSKARVAAAYGSTVVACYLVAWSSVYLVLSEGDDSRYFDDLFFVRGGELEWFTALYATLVFIPLLAVSLYLVHRGLKPKASE